MKRWRIYVAVSMLLVVAVSALSAEQRSRRYDDCRVDDVESYYGEELKKDYDTRRHAEEIADMLYRGPLMRDGDKDGLRALAGVVRKQKFEVREAERIVRGHLYGDSDEFRNLLKELEEKYDDEREAAFKVLNSIYGSFSYYPESPREEDFDACLILDRKAYLVVTKALVDWMERKDLD